MKRWKCPKCGKWNDEEDTTCLTCGFDVPLDKDCQPIFKGIKTKYAE